MTTNTVLTPAQREAIIQKLYGSKATAQEQALAIAIEQAAVELDRQQAMPPKEWFDTFMELARDVAVANRAIARDTSTANQKLTAEAAQALQDHARRRLADDRQGRGDPVAWGIFYQGVMQQGWAYNEAAANAIATEDYPDVKVEVKPLYLATQPAEPVKEVSELEALKIIGYYADMRVMAAKERATKEQVSDAWIDVIALLARYGSKS